MGESKKRHHYIPRFYVAGFTNKDGRVFVLDKEKGVINKQSKEGTFHRRKFYTVNFSKYKKKKPEDAARSRAILGLESVDTSQVKEYPDMVEDLLGEMETASAPILKKLVSQERINPRERMEFSTFVAAMYARNPYFHNIVSRLEEEQVTNSIERNLSSKEKLQEIYAKMKKEGYDKEVDIDAIHEVIENKRFSVKIPKESNIEIMLLAIVTIDKILYDKTWFILKAPADSAFVSSETPVFLDHPVLNAAGAFGAGFDTPGVKVFFPLNANFLLVAQKTNERGKIFYGNADKAEVRKINELIYLKSKEYVMANNEPLLVRLKKICKKIEEEGSGTKPSKN